MDRIDIEESNAKCHICASGLTYLEHLLYGNRCIFCAEKIKNIKSFTFLARAYYDWKIYQRLAAIKYQEDGRIKLIACLGEIGFIDINECRTVEDKRALLNALRRIRG